MQRRVIYFKNSTGGAIPAGAAIEPYGGYDTDGHMKVRQPTRDNAIDVLFNGPGQVPVGGIGEAYPCFPFAAASLATEPQFFREHYGTKAGSWQLHTDRRGFVVVGTEYNRLCDVMPSPMVESQAFDNESGGISGGISGGSNDPGPTVTLGTVQTGQECIEGITTITLVDHVVYADGRSGYINERTQTAGCCGCTDPPLTGIPPSHASCCGEDSFTYPGKILARGTNPTGDISAWPSFAARDVVVHKAAPSAPGSPDTLPWGQSEPPAPGESWITLAAYADCYLGDAFIRLSPNAFISGGLSGTFSWGSLVNDWEVDPDNSQAVIKYFACDATYDLTTPENVGTMTITGTFNATLDIQLRVPT